MEDRMKMDMDAIRTRLLSMRAALLQLMETSRVDPQPEVDKTRSGRLTRMDELRSEAMSAETVRRRKAELARIEAALARLDEGDYGLCTVCGEAIAAGRLGADPAVEQCIRCATLAEQGGKGTPQLNARP